MNTAQQTNDTVVINKLMKEYSILGTQEGSASVFKKRRSGPK
jgi:hypothetical protein